MDWYRRDSVRRGDCFRLYVYVYIYIYIYIYIWQRPINSIKGNGTTWPPGQLRGTQHCGRPCYRPISVDILRYRPISVDIGRYRLISADISQYPPISGDIGRYRLNCTPRLASIFFQGGFLSMTHSKIYMPEVIGQGEWKMRSEMEIEME